jgi:peptidoglycan-N-acetylglucosamine deacetylase
MMSLTFDRFWHGLRPWRGHVALAVASIAVLCVPTRSLYRLQLNTFGIAKEIQCAWSRFVARHEGVIVFSRGDPNDRAICLTFDDGPHPKTCGAILDVLREQGVHATFFPVGFRLQQYPALLDRIVAEGHEVGNHTWNHQRLSGLTTEQVRQEIRQVRDLVYRRTGIAPVLVRPPGGTYNTRVLEICRDEGFEVCLWTANAGDWKRMTVNELVAKVLDQVHPGSIVLMHDEFMQTPEALRRIIPELKERGYRFVTASELRGAPPPAYERPVPEPEWNLARLR